MLLRASLLALFLAAFISSLPIQKTDTPASEGLTAKDTLIQLYPIKLNTYKSREKLVKSHAECSMTHPFWSRLVRKYDSILASAHNTWIPSDRFGRIAVMPKHPYHDEC